MQSNYSAVTQGDPHRPDDQARALTVTRFADAPRFNEQMERPGRADLCRRSRAHLSGATLDSFSIEYASFPDPAEFKR